MTWTNVVLLGIAYWAIGCANGSVSGDTGAAGSEATGGAAGNGAGSPGTGGGAAGSGGGTGGNSSPSGTGGTGPIDEVREALSGTRLKAYWYTTADGAKSFAGSWYDSTLKTDCSFVKGTDGILRCSPALGPGYGTKFFSDSGCSTPLVGVSAATSSGSACRPATPTPMYLSFSDESSCFQVFIAGPPFTGQTYSGKPGACTANPVAVYNTAYNFFSLGTALDLATLQAVTLAHD